jgi:hypothetical protein
MRHQLPEQLQDDKANLLAANEEHTFAAARCG